MMGKCWVCFKVFDEEYEIILDVLPQQYMVCNEKYKLDTYPTPKYMGICPLCDANGVSNSEISFTNQATTNCVSGYIRENREYFIRRLYERQNL